MYTHTPDSIILKYCEKQVQELAVVVHHVGKCFKILMLSSNIERKTISIFTNNVQKFSRVATRKYFSVCEKKTSIREEFRIF